MSWKHWTRNIVVAAFLAGSSLPIAMRVAGSETAYACGGQTFTGVSAGIGGSGWIGGYTNVCGATTWVQGRAQNYNFNAYLKACDWGNAPGPVCSGSIWEAFPNGSVWSPGSVYCRGCSVVQGYDNNDFGQTSLF
ncbi:MAG: hypothetical protein M3Y74_00820 [Chloroflexota bacterium]|nr:hypothetical protein [Chloroflexota bacterium]